ncbi:MAG TPA: hypothetical protein PK014_14060 [Thermoanaerobaculia bacterium]|nr:hypothetical protein [Thermoanaerobaculia bacterium]HUM31188.1 hypothetical protein [Thermoanaerobaculia bacterium]HXK69575.1 hypothetical protein [Thermoanaerobaculia bacterium]
MMEVRPFTARATYALKPDQYYRVYVDGDSIYFVRISGQSLAAGVAGGLEAQLGSLGRSLGAGLVRRAKRKLFQAGMEADKKDYRTLGMADKRSFRKSTAEIRSAVIDPAEAISGHGMHVGVWRLEFSDGKKLRLQFEEISEMKKAVDGLPGVFGEKLKVNAAWNERGGGFSRA